jgi:peptidoglycan/LPS O-acetylase OafA/YrhL
MSGEIRNSAKTRTIPSLDGLRAISIALVILSHARETRGFPAWIPNFVSDGTLGVQVFFIISGFLITTLLIQEQASTGTISLGLFYARRTLRIFPPFYCFLAIVAVATWMGLLAIPPRNFLFAATYTMNYMSSGGAWVTGHIWSLSVEEQFYMVWPLIMKLSGQRRAFWIAATLAITGPLILLAVYLIDHGVGGRLTMYFPLVADSIAAGCVLAGILPWLRRKPIFRWFASPAGDLVIPLIFLLNLGRPHPRIHFALTETALNLCICYAIVRYIEFPGCSVGRILNNPAVSFIGKLSYSLYIWQQIFMNRYGTGLVQAFPINVAASFGCALASYYSLELPMAGMRKRLQPVMQASPQPRSCDAVPGSV